MRLIFAASLLLATAADAQTATPDADRIADSRAKLLAADANKDGKWDKAEWVAAGRRERGFGFLDVDNDGFVTQTELRDGMMKMRSMRGTPE